MRIIRNSIQINTPTLKPKSVKKRFILVLYYLAISFVMKLPGAKLHFLSMRWAIQLLFKRDKKYFVSLALSPFDSFRYFEYSFFVANFRQCDKFLDVSSPRLLYLFLLRKYKQLAIYFTNPDKNDLDLTVRLLAHFNYLYRVKYSDVLVDALPFPDASFPLITCMSVLEHIPGNGDQEAIKILWKKLKPGGTLLISVPCANEPFEEFLNINEYNLHNEDGDGFFFGQRFYNEQLLNERIYNVIGLPIKKEIYGEKEAGIFFNNRKWKWSGNYPDYKESFFFARDYRRFSSISELPGIGVVAMEFQKCEGADRCF